MWAIFQRELKSYFNGFIAWITAAVLLLFAGIFTMYYNLVNATPYFEYVIGNMGFIYLLVVPLLSMRVIAEERKQKTDQLLYALPMGMRQIVLGKYFAQLVVIALPIGVMCLYPLLLTMYGTINLASAYSCLFAFFFMGAALLAVGFFLSSLTENQAIAAGLSFLVLLLNYYLPSLAVYVPSTASASWTALSLVILLIGIVLYFLTKNGVFALALTLVAEAALFIWDKISAESFEGLFSDFIGQLSVFDHFYVFTDGVFDLSTLLYFTMIAFLFLFLSVQSLEKRRWS